MARNMFKNLRGYYLFDGESFYCLGSVEIINTFSWTAGTASRTSWHTTSWHSTSWHATHSWHTSSTGLLVDTHHNWVEFGLELLLLALNGVGIGVVVALEPLKTLLRGLFNSLLLVFGENVL